MEWIISLIALTLMEIVLGIDNIVFIAILAGRLPEKDRAKARKLGLLAALVTRVMLLFAITWVLTLEKVVIVELSAIGVPEAWLVEEDDGHRSAVDEHDGPGASGSRPAVIDQHLNQFTIKDLVLLAGGLFLIWKSVHEIHNKLEGEEEKAQAEGSAGLTGTIIQIAIMDIVFSIDSVITAVGMAKHLWVMVTAIIIAVAVMIAFANPVSNFVDRNPTVKMLALSFLILIGVMLVAESVGTPINKGYIYFAMTFALGVEMLNLKLRSKESTPAIV